MNFKSTFTASAATLSLVFALTAHAQTTDVPPAKPLGGEKVAMRMVPATTILKQMLDAEKVTKGFAFQAKLYKAVQLDNGPLLPAGTILQGTVVSDNLNLAGTSKLALRFTLATLGNGESVPIKATIVGIYAPDDTVAPGSQEANHWDENTLAVDQLGVLNGIDLHSKVAEANSGVLVSDKRDVQLGPGTEIALAITPQQPARKQVAKK